MQIFSVKDSAVGAFMQPFTSQSRGAAIRAFADAVNDSSTPMNKHPDDYELYEIGTFEEETGVVQGKLPECVARGKDVIVREKK